MPAMTRCTRLRQPPWPLATCVARNQPMRRCFECAGLRISLEEDEVHAVREFAA